MIKKREPNFDVIRAVSTVAIVLFHYSYTFYEFNISASGPEFLVFSNGDYGEVFVAVFFMLSGGVLLFNYPVLYDSDKRSTLKNVADYYVNRWLAIFPMFYLGWFVMYILQSVHYGTWLWGGSAKNFILSFIGMDGYFLHWGSNYYSIGEWFIGGIIFMYLLYPELLFLWNHARAIVTLFISLTFLFNLRRQYCADLLDGKILGKLIKYYNDHIIISDNRCIWTCLASFFIGFILVTYCLPFVKRLQGTEYILFSFAVIFGIIVMLCIKLPLFKQEACIILAFMICIFLMLLTPIVQKSKTIFLIIKTISKYSYGVFLAHHVILYYVMKRVRDYIFTWVSSMVFFIPLFAFIMLVSFILTRIPDLIKKYHISILKGHDVSL